MSERGTLNGHPIQLRATGDRDSVTSNNADQRCLTYLVRTAIANEVIEPGLFVTVLVVVVTGTLIGYARCSTEEQDLTAQRQQLRDLGVSEDRIYLDHGLTGTNRARPGLDQALAAVRAGDTLVVPKLDRLARSVPDARAIGDDLAARGIRLSLGGQLYDPTDPMGKMFFNILATFAEFEVDLLRMRTREGMAIARAKGRLKGRQPKLTAKQQTELRRMHASGDYTITDLAELFRISRPTVYRTIRPSASAPA